MWNTRAVFDVKLGQIMNMTDTRETTKTQNDKSVDSASNDILNQYAQYVVAE